MENNGFEMYFYNGYRLTVPQSNAEVEVKIPANSTPVKIPFCSQTQQLSELPSHLIPIYRHMEECRQLCQQVEKSSLQNLVKFPLVLKSSAADSAIPASLKGQPKNLHLPNLPPDITLWSREGDSEIVDLSENFDPDSFIQTIATGSPVSSTNATTTSQSNSTKVSEISETQDYPQRQRTFDPPESKREMKQALTGQHLIHEYKPEAHDFAPRIQHHAPTQNHFQSHSQNSPQNHQSQMYPPTTQSNSSSQVFLSPFFFFPSSFCFQSN